MPLAPFFLSFSAFASPQYTIGVGLGQRNIERAEGSIEDYLEERKYTDMVAGIEDSVDLEGVTLPYFALEGGYRAQRLRNVEYRFAVNWSSSLFGSEEDAEEVPIMYEGADLGDASVAWEYFLNFYGSIGSGVETSVCRWGRRTFSLEGSVAALAGISYLDAQANLSFDVTKMAIYDTLGSQFVEDEFGIAGRTEAEARVKGVGYFFQPVFRPSMHFAKMELHGDIGYRWETVPVTVQEHSSGLSEQDIETKANFNGSGVVMGFLLEYHFGR